jgi:Ser/Thr protein kinase RdoA (MazF antagonist)
VSPPPAIERLLTEQVGRPWRCVPLGAVRGTQARTWRVVGARGEAVLKCHHEAAAWHRERDAYAGLACLQGEILPRLLGFVPPPTPALLLSKLPGAPAHGMESSNHDVVSVHRCAGEAKGRIDDVSCPQEPVGTARAYAMRFEHWCRRARGRVPEALLRDAVDLFDPLALPDAPRTWCHRDFTPCNWLVETTPTGPRLYVIDLGQTRPDLPLIDLVKLREGTWQTHPALEHAFCEGWGRELDTDDRHVLDRLGLLHGLATATWADAHGDPSLHRRGLAVLDRRIRTLRSGG